MKATVFYESRPTGHACPGHWLGVAIEPLANEGMAMDVPGTEGACLPHPNTPLNSLLEEAYTPDAGISCPHLQGPWHAAAGAVRCLRTPSPDRWQKPLWHQDG